MRLCKFVIPFWLFNPCVNVLVDFSSFSEMQISLNYELYFVSSYSARMCSLICVFLFSSEEHPRVFIGPSNTQFLCKICIEKADFN